MRSRFGGLVLSESLMALPEDRRVTAVPAAAAASRLAEAPDLDLLERAPLPTGTASPEDPGHL
ncbi:MAG: hypothetical protein MUE73_09175 [Planctomycetes bacterium]|nr:hypothetical protein [Planctomycetota bacterium]